MKTITIPVLAQFEVPDEMSVNEAIATFWRNLEAQGTIEIQIGTNPDGSVEETPVSITNWHTNKSE